MRSRRLLRGTLIAAIVLLRGVANAESAGVAAAQALFDQAKRLMAADNYAEACPKLEESQRLDPALGTVLNLADCYEKEGRLASAWSRFVEAQGIAHAGGHPDAENVARDRAALLSGQLSKLVIDVENAEATPGVEITRDGVVVGSAQWGVPIPADAGTHVLRATAPGRRRWETKVEVGAGAAIVTVRMPVLEPESDAATVTALPATGAMPTPPQAPAFATPPAADRASAGEGSWSGAKTAAVVLGGLAVVATGTAAFEWVTFENKKTDAENDCPANGCYRAQYDAALAHRDDEKMARTIGIAAGLVGAASLAGAAALWLTATQETNRTARVKVTPMAGRGEVGIRVGGTW